VVAGLADAIAFLERVRNTPAFQTEVAQGVSTALTDLVLRALELGDDVFTAYTMQGFYVYQKTKFLPVPSASGFSDDPIAALKDLLGGVEDFLGESLDDLFGTNLFDPDDRVFLTFDLRRQILTSPARTVKLANRRLGRVATATVRDVSVFELNASLPGFYVLDPALSIVGTTGAVGEAPGG
jgi:hypothetical protein